MAQGFKLKSTAASSSSSSKSGSKDPKKGARTYAPKKSKAVAASLRKKQMSSNANLTLENEMASRAASKGKLTIMKNSAKEGDKANSKRKK